MTGVNSNFFNEAMKSLKAGSKAADFATNYANASKAAKGSSLWQQYYDEGLKQFSTMDIHNGQDGVIDDEEFKIVGLYVERMNGKDHSFNTTIEEFSGNDQLENFRGSDNPELTAANPNLPEQHNLKPVSTMTKEEIQAELTKYKELGFLDSPDAKTDKKDDTPEKGTEETPAKDAVAKQADNSNMPSWIKDFKKSKTKTDNTGSEDMELKTLRKELDAARAKYNSMDAKSDEVDFHIGTFNQGSFGDCTLLSQINGLSDEQMKRIVKQKTDENGKVYYEVTFPMDEGTNKTVKITKEELDSRRLKVTDGNTERTVSSFATGDADVTLLEMAYIKRFGINPVIEGADEKLVHDIFTYPAENTKHVGGSYDITEEKLLQAVQNGDHATVTIKATSRLPHDFKYTDTYTASDGTTAGWVIENADKRTAILQRLAEMNEKYGNKNFDISEYEQMSDTELMEATYRFVSNDYYFIGELKLSSGASLIENHAYTLKGYDPQTKQVTLSNPHHSNEDIVVPLEIAQRYLEIST